MARILVVASLASSLIRFRGDLISALLDAGHKVWASAPDTDEASLGALATLGVPLAATKLSRAGVNPFADLAYVRSLYHLLHKVAPDVVLAYTPKPVIYSGFACRFIEGVRHYALITGLGYGFGRETLRQRALTPIMSALFKIGLSRSAGVIFQNPDDRSLFVERGLVIEGRTSLVSGSGVDTGKFAVQPLPSVPAFLMMARLIPEKGVREYVEAARRVRVTTPTARFLLAGWLEQRRGSITRAEIDTWQDEGVIEYLGALDDVRPAIARASIYVLPSYYREGVPRSILEAMAMGRAVITTDMPGCRETVVEGHNGFLVPPRNSMLLARAMERLASSMTEVVRMGAASRKMVEERFAVDRVNAQMIAAMRLAS